MLEDADSRLKRLLESCECDVAVPSEWQERLARRGTIPSIPGDRRRYIRHRFGGRAIIEYDTTFPAIPRGRTLKQVVTRDLSRGGIAFLHSEQLFPGERISLLLPDGKREYVVVRCLEHNARCFEIGAEVADGKVAAPAPLAD